VKKKEINIGKKSIEIARSFLSRVSNKLNEAKEHLESYHYSESISASLECIELSIKAVFLLVKGEYPRRHEFREKEFKNILKKIPEELKYLDFPKLYLYTKLWGGFHTAPKYGFENLGVGADKLFEKEEADLALKHAKKCKNTADQLKINKQIRQLAKEALEWKDGLERIGKAEEEALKKIKAKKSLEN